MPNNQSASEPVLNVSNIQGNIIPGFNKDYQALLFLKIEDGKESNFGNFRGWLETLAPHVTTMEQVLVFKSLLTEEERRGKPPKVKTTWINIAFSHAALQKLGAIKENADFKDKAFISETGMRRRSEEEDLGDPTDPGAEGHPQNWVVGGPGKEADVILIVASDDRLDLFAEVTRIGNSINELPKTDEEQPVVRVIFTQYGANLPGRREHFGFRDGVSQPGVRGQISGNFGSYLTPHYEDESQGKPGQDLVWPGEFVFGAKYPKEGLTDDKTARKNSLDEVDKDIREFAEDGSFLVFRRLRQDVGAFHTFLHKTALELSMDPNLLGAKCVGRWASGAPILRAPKQDDAKWAQDDSKNNDFTFTEEDPEGQICPFASHIRKIYPRDDVLKSEAQLSPEKQTLNESITQTHRLLRRGIPYGEPSWSSPTAPYRDTVDRGLLFLAYQTSIVNQFEFLQQQANKPNFKEDKAGHDPIIGQNGQSKTRERHFMVAWRDSDEKKQQRSVPITEEWVIPTGGGYFFAPSIEALHSLANSRKSIVVGAPPDAITREDWARIWAHAWLPENKDFKETLKRNPAAAVEEFKQKYSLPDHDKLFDLVGDIYKKPFHRGPFEGMSFNGMSTKDLKEIAEKGTLHGKPFCVQQNEWVIVHRK